MSPIRSPGPLFYCSTVVLMKARFCIPAETFGELFLLLHRRLPHLYSLWYHEVQSCGTDPHSSPTFTAMATDKSTSEPPHLDEKNDEEVISDVSLVNPSSHGEPIVTRRELWSYYCKRCRDFSSLQWF